MPTKKITTFTTKINTIIVMVVKHLSDEYKQGNLFNI